MIVQMVIENLRCNLLQTSVKILAIGIEVSIILTLVGIQRGMGTHPSLARLNFGIYVSILLLFAFAVSFIFATIGQYSEVLERTQEIGILRVLGASSAYILNLLSQETLIVTLLGTLVGIGIAYGAKWLIAFAFSDYLTFATVYKWWPLAYAISSVGPLSGAVFALRRSLKHGVIQALSPEE